MLAFTIISVYACVVFFELIPLFRQKKKKEAWIYSVILAGSFCLLMLFSIGIEIPGPSDFILDTVKKVFPAQ